jgi:hypothetical protein
MINEPLILYICFMVIAALISTYGSFVTLPYEHLPMWDAIKMALPYAWVDWVFLTIAISIGKEHNLVTPLQMKFSLTIFKFLLILLFTKYYLNKEVSLSDIIGFLIVVLAYFVGLFHLASKYILGRDVANKIDANGGATGQQKPNLEKEKEKEKEPSQ